MTKWDTLLAGGSESPILQQKPESTFDFLPIAMIVIFVVVFATFIATTNSSSSANRVDTIAQEVGTVISQSVKAENEPDRVEPKVNLVKAKFAGKKFFDDAAPEYDDSPYGEFARTLDNGRDLPQIERPLSENARLMQDQLGPMREAVKKSGKSLSQFINENDAYVPDELIDAWSNDHNENVAESEHQILDDEERVIARDAFQSVPMKASPEEAVVILRDVLASRSEAAKRGIKLPQMPEDQEASIKYWTSTVGPASKLAQSILQKI